MSSGNKSTRDKRLYNGPYAITNSQNATQRNNRLSLFNNVKANILIRIKDIKVKRQALLKKRLKRRIFESKCQSLFISIAIRQSLIRYQS